MPLTVSSVVAMQELSVVVDDVVVVAAAAAVVVEMIDVMSMLSVEYSDSGSLLLQQNSVVPMIDAATAMVMMIHCQHQ
jgi:hypothetical protein